MSFPKCVEKKEEGRGKKDGKKKFALLNLKIAFCQPSLEVTFFASRSL
jgi:hypothetical protein